MSSTKTISAGHGLLLALILMLALLPVWLEPELVTQDGPSHVYNAALARWAHAGQEPFASSFDAKTGVQPNAATHVLLTSLAAPLGWPMAERVLVTLAVLATFLGVVMLVSPTVALIPLIGWLASGWFLWMGFYDFVISIPCFIALLIALRQPPSRSRTTAMLVAFVALYLTHIFTLAIGIGLVTTTLAWNARNAKGAWRDLWVVAPAAALLFIELAGGTAGGGAREWTNGVASRIVALFTGDYAVVLLGPDSLAGITLVAVTVASIIALVRHRDVGGMIGPELFGIALLVFSFVAPDSVGEGGFIPIRLRLLGTLALFPAIAGTLRRLRPRAQRLMCAVLVAAFSARTYWIIADARGFHDDRVAVSALLSQAGASKGAWLAGRLTAYRRWPFRVGAYRHIAERVAIEEQLVVLNNYEALNGIFAVKWRARPDWVVFRPLADTIEARFVPGSVPWSGALYVLHERYHPLASADPSLRVDTTLTSGRFAISVLRRLK